MKKNLTFIILNIAVSAIFIGLIFVPMIVRSYVAPIYNTQWEFIGYSTIVYRHSMLDGAPEPSIFLIAFLGLNLAYNSLVLFSKNLDIKGWVNLLTIALSVASFVLCFIVSDYVIMA